MERLFFSIVIPTYQRRDVVCDAVRALCSIEYDPCELIVVIDGSTDGTAGALATIRCPFPLRIIEQPNAGAASARNRGAAVATGDILLFLDDDMMARPDLVKQHARSHRTGAVAVLGHIPLDPASPPSFLTDGVAKWADERARRLRGGARLSLFDLLTGQLSVRRSLFEELGGFDDAFTAGGGFGNEDLDFGMRLLERAPIEFNPDAVSLQRYVVTPRELIRQCAQAGRADVALARKHPAKARELFDLRGARNWTTRLLLRPLAAVPGLGRALSDFAIWVTDKESRLPRLLRPAGARLFSAARDMMYWASVRQAGGVPLSRRALILCYHAIADLSADPVLREYGIDRNTFAAQLDSLSARGFTFVSPDEAAALFEDQGSLPRKAVLLTIDDCYQELADLAQSVLEPRGVRGIAFAVSGMRSGTNEWDQAIGAGKLRLLDGRGLQELRRHGIEIGCHSRSHRPLPGLSAAAFVEETSAAADDLAAMGLPRPRFFAYPHGANDRKSREAARTAGFAAAFGLSSARATPASDRFNLPRIEILARDIGWRFWLKTAWPRLSALLDYRSMLQAARARAVRALRRIGAIPART